LLATIFFPSRAHGEHGLFNVELDIGGTALATDTAAEDVKRAGLDLSVSADMPLKPLPMLAPQIGYTFDFLPGKAGIHMISAGLRARVLDDDSGYGLSPLWPSGAKKGSFHGNLYVEAGLGYVHAPTAGGDDHWFGFSFGVGYQVSLTSPIQMGPYVRYQHVVFNDAKDPVFISFGVSISFGYPKKIEAAPAEPKRPPEKMAEPTLEGKPGDRDGDGVGDATDLCPITAPGVTVDDKGCMELRGKMIFPELLFEKSTVRLPPDALLLIKRLADVLKAHSNVYVRVVSFSDELPSETENLALAEKRAQKIRKLLMEHGVQAARIQAEGSRPKPPPPGEAKTPWWERRTMFRFRVGGFPQ
jgi:outer membrane protein OmpA-like peptidoglycan-associated protein